MFLDVILGVADGFLEFEISIEDSYKKDFSGLKKSHIK
jgi:hypothetical protein